jgi:hypothetical protein
VKTPSCPHETDVFDLVWTGQWPARADSRLRAHVAECAICADLLIVSSAIGQLDASEAAVKLPDAGAVWYSAQLRARHELSHRAARPVLVAEMAAFACIVGGLSFSWRLMGPSVSTWLAAMPWPEAPALPRWSDLVALASTPTFPWMAGAACAWALVIPTALYIARLADRTTEQRQDRS